MNILESKMIRAATAAAGAATLALVSMYLMTLMNRHVLLPVPEQAIIRCVTLQASGPRTRDTHERPENSNADDSTDTPIPRVDLRSLPQPAADVPPVEALKLLVEAPSLNPHAIRLAAGTHGPFPGPFAASAGGATAGGPPGSAAADNSALPSADQVDQPPREPAGNPQPEFPERERQLGIEGEVVMELLIDESGRVIDVRFISGPQAFRQAVSRVARSWRFEPARHRGRAVKVWAVKEVGFTLRRGRS
jgi:TonB family protein